jgi:hypothetical protein
LPQITTVNADIAKSTVCQKADSCIAANAPLFGHIAGEGEQSSGHVEAERFGSLEVYDQLEMVGWITGNS